MRSLRIVVLFLLASLSAYPVIAQAPKHSKKKQPGISIAPAPKSNSFIPTCNLDSGSVGFYFFPANLGAKWTMRAISQTLDLTNTVLKCDTTYSFERVVSDSNLVLQGLPVLRCESSRPYREGHEAEAQVIPVEYYVDDSTVIAVFNHSISNNMNHTLLVNPLREGAAWRDKVEDTIITRVLTMNEPVETPLGSFPKCMVVRTVHEAAEMSKYFAPGVGIVKTVFRGASPRRDLMLVVTSELIALDRGDPSHSISRRFQALAPVKMPVIGHSKKPSQKKVKH